MRVGGRSILSEEFAGGIILLYMRMNKYGFISRSIYIMNCCCKIIISAIRRYKELDVGDGLRVTNPLSDTTRIVGATSADSGSVRGRGGGNISIEEYMWWH
jgi:hypothetical protein